MHTNASLATAMDFPTDVILTKNCSVELGTVVTAPTAGKTHLELTVNGAVTTTTGVAVLRNVRRVTAVLLAHKIYSVR